MIRITAKNRWIFYSQLTDCREKFATLTCNYVCLRRYPARCNDGRTSSHSCCRRCSEMPSLVWKCSMSRKTWTWTSSVSASNWLAGRTREPRATRPSICRVMQAWYHASCARARFQDRERPFVSWKNPSWLSNKSRLWSQFTMLKIDPSRTKSTQNHHHFCCRNCSWNWLLLTSKVKISKRMTGMLIRAPVMSMAWGLGLWK